MDIAVNKQAQVATIDRETRDLIARMVDARRDGRRDDTTMQRLNTLSRERVRVVSGGAIAGR